MALVFVRQKSTDCVRKASTGVGDGALLGSCLGVGITGSPYCCIGLFVNSIDPSFVVGVILRQDARHGVM